MLIGMRNQIELIKTLLCQPREQLIVLGIQLKNGKEGTTRLMIDKQC
jgi:hypothetical protein